MAGGTDPRAAQRGPLVERLGLPAPPAAPPRRRPQKPPFHCWVVDCPELPGRRPGLLVEWARGPEGRWRARVVLAATGVEGPLILTLWVADEHLQPLSSD